MVWIFSLVVLTLIFYIFLHKGRSITFLQSNDADLIKKIIGFYKIISYLHIPWSPGKEVGGKVWEAARRVD